MPVTTESTGALRSQQTDLTRRLILDAVAELVVEEGVHAFSVQNVADRAGVSHRTVYRHFPSREALLEALVDSINQPFREQDITEPETLADLRAAVTRGFAALAERDRMVRAYVLLTVGARLRSRSREERTRRFGDILRAELGDRVDDPTIDAVAAVSRLLWSSTGWHVLTDEHDLDDATASEVVAWVIETILGELAAGRGPEIDRTAQADQPEQAEQAEQSQQKGEA